MNIKRRLALYMPQFFEFMRGNSEWLILSLSLSLIIWMVAILDQNPVQQREFESIRVEYIESSDVIRSSNLVINNRRVNVTLRAPRSTWEVINSQDIRVYADLRHLTPGTHLVELKGEIVNEDLRGRVVSISPAQISVELVEVRERLIQVTPEISGIPSREYVVSQPQCDPNQIAVRGPQPEIDRIASAVVRLDLSNATESTTLDSPLIIFDAANRPMINLTLTPDSVLCQVTVEQRQDRDLVRVIPNVIGQVPDGYVVVEEFRVDPADVEVAGDEAAITAMQSLVITEPIDVNNQTETFSRVVSVLLPEGVRLVPSTQRVTVTITIIEETITRNFEGVPVQVVNLDLPLEIELTPQNVNVAVTGPRSLVDTLTAEDISITVDVNGLGEGVHENLPMQTTLLRESLQDADIGLVIQPNSITTTIRLLPTPTFTPPAIFGRQD